MGGLPVCLFCTICVPGAHGDQKSVLDPLGLELKIVVWVLGIKPGPSTGAARAEPNSNSSLYVLRQSFDVLFCSAC